MKNIVIKRTERIGQIIFYTLFLGVMLCALLVLKTTLGLDSFTSVGLLFIPMGFWALVCGEISYRIENKLLKCYNNNSEHIVLEDE